MTQKKFFQTLFDDTDEICLGSTKYDTALIPVNNIFQTNAQWFTINALHTSRADANVTKHRTFLLEIDNMPLAAQEDAVKAVPKTAKVFSGNKSFHYFITLEQPVAADVYTSIFKRLQMLVPALDKSCKNPSRFARTPFAVRPDTRTSQDLLMLNGRINNNELLSILPPLPVEAAKPIEKDIVWLRSSIQHAVTLPDEAMLEIHLDGRNNFFFWLGQRLLEAGYSKEQRKEFIKKAYTNLRNKQKFSLSEALLAGRVK